MFMCTDCHKKEKCEFPHTFSSRGRCEVCRNTANCCDCRAYKKTEAKAPEAFELADALAEAAEELLEGDGPMSALRIALADAIEEYRESRPTVPQERSDL